MDLPVWAPKPFPRKILKKFFMSSVSSNQSTDTASLSADEDPDARSGGSPAGGSLAAGEAPLLLGAGAAAHPLCHCGTPQVQGETMTTMKVWWSPAMVQSCPTMRGKSPVAFRLEDLEGGLGRAAADAIM